MSSLSPVSVLFSSDGYELATINGSAIPANTRGLLVEGSDGTNSRFMAVDVSGRTVIVGAGVAGTATGGVLTVQGAAGMTAITVSGTITANQGTSPWVENISQFGGSNVVTGTGASGAGIPRVTVSNDSNILATQSGTWTVQPGNTPNTTPWLFTINQGSNSAAVKAASTAPVAADPALVVTLSPNGNAIDGYVTTAAPTYSNNTANYLSLTTAGALRVDGSAVTQPVSVSGTVSVTVSKSTTGTLTNVAAATSSTTLLASNAARISATFFNDTTSSVLYLGLTSSTVSQTSYTIKIMPGSYWELPIDYTGQINGIWNSASGAVRITELS